MGCPDVIQLRPIQIHLAFWHMADHTNCRTVDLVIRKFDSMYVYKLRIFALPWLFPAWAVAASFAEISDVFFVLACCRSYASSTGQRILLSVMLHTCCVQASDISAAFAVAFMNYDHRNFRRFFVLVLQSTMVDGQSQLWRIDWIGRVSCDELIGKSDMQCFTRNNWHFFQWVNALLSNCLQWAVW